MNTKLTILSSEIKEWHDKQTDNFGYNFEIKAQIDGYPVTITNSAVEWYEALHDCIFALQNTIEAFDPQPGKYTYTIHDSFNVKG